MREINEIHDADIKAMAALDKNCLDLHLFPPPKTFIQMEVEGPDGTKVESRKMRSQSWHRNAYNLILGAIAGLPASAISTSYGPGSIAIASTGGYNFDTSRPPQPTNNGPVGIAGSGDWGIVVGYEDSPETFNDFTMRLQAPNGTGLLPIKGVNPTGQLIYSTDVRFGRNGDYFTVTTNSSPFLGLYSFDKTTKRTQKITFTGGPTQITYSAEMSPCGRYIAAHISSYAKIYKYNNETNVLTEVFSATCAAYGSYDSVGWSPNGDYVFFCAGNPSASVLAKNNRNDTFTLYSLSAIQNVVRCSWSEDSTYLAIVTTVSPYMKIFKNNGDGTLTEISTTLGLSGQANKLSWSPDGKYLAASIDASPYLFFVKKTGVDTFAKISPTITGVSSAILQVEFSADGKHIVFRPTDSSYAKVGIIKNNDDDTFVLVNAGFSIDSSASSNNIYRITRHPTINYFLFSLFQNYPYYGLFSVGPGLAYSEQNATVGTYSAEAKKMSITMTRAINNNTTEIATIKELGLITRLGSSNIMLSRDVLAEPLIVPPAYKLTVTYTMEMTFPA